MKRRFSWMLAVGAAGLLAALPATAGAAVRTTPSRVQPVVPGSRYLAIGDSVTFGYMESNVVPAPNYHNASNFLGHPEQFGALSSAVALFNGVSIGLNRALDGAAKPFGVRIADGYGLMKLAANRGGAQGNTCKAGLLTQLSTDACGVHPSYAGQAVLAQAL